VTTIIPTLPLTAKVKTTFSVTFRLLNKICNSNKLRKMSIVSKIGGGIAGVAATVAGVTIVAAVCSLEQTPNGVSFSEVSIRSVDYPVSSAILVSSGVVLGMAYPRHAAGCALVLGGLTVLGGVKYSVGVVNLDGR
jgi:hypothetical protein